MTYTLDLEATQYTQEIISIGLYCLETEEEFYSLVRPLHKVGKYVTDITGLTNTELKKEPPISTVLESLFNSFGFGEDDVIFTFGQSDKIFLLKTYNYAIDHQTRQRILKLLSIVEDFQYSLHSPPGEDISLKAAVEELRGEPVEQTHNALRDAKLLAELVEYYPFSPAPHKVTVIATIDFFGEERYYTKVAEIATRFKRRFGLEDPFPQLCHKIAQRIGTNRKICGYYLEKKEF